MQNAALQEKTLHVGGSAELHRANRDVLFDVFDVVFKKTSEVEVEQDQLLIYLPSQKNKQDSQIDRVPNPQQMERTHPEAILQ